jgi:opacity protein-like surface antigen
MNSKKALEALLVSALALLFAPALSAKGFSYSFADVGYNHLSGDEYDMDGAAVDAVFGVHDYVALRGGYTRGWTDGFPKDRDPSGNPDVNQFRVGLEPHYSLFKSLDLVADLIYVNTKFNGDRSRTDIGYIYGAGIRYQSFKRVELRLAGEYVSGNVDKAFLVLGPVIKLTKTFDLSLRTSYSSDYKDYFAGLRMNF